MPPTTKRELSCWDVNIEPILLFGRVAITGVQSDERLRGHKGVFGAEQTKHEY